MTQQVERTTDSRPSAPRFPGKVPGEAGIWVLILGDMVMFAIFFGVIMVLRGQHPEMFVRGQHRLHRSLGGINTGLLLTSSLCVATAVRSARAGGSATRPLLAAIACGVGFGAIKGLEYTSLVSGGVTPQTNHFFMYYFVFTGIHLLHLVIGLGVLLFMLSRNRGTRVRSDHDVMVLECGASFWHMVDLLWIVLFPLLYLVH